MILAGEQESRRDEAELVVAKVLEKEHGLDPLREAVRQHEC